MSVLSQGKYSALIMNKVWTQYDQIIYLELLHTKQSLILHILE